MKHVTGHKKMEGNDLPRNTLMRKAFAVVLLFGLLASIIQSPVIAADSEGGNLHTVYHIYADGNYVGMIEDTEKLDHLKEEKIKEAKKEYENFPLVIGTDLSIVSEKVFSAEMDEQAALDQLDQLLTVEAEAVGMQIDGNIAFYVRNEEVYDEVVRRLKLQSVSEEKLADFEARSALDSIPPLQADETRIQEIILSADLQPVQGKAKPAEILSADKALKLLNKGTLEEKTYAVQEGDVLGSIASAHDMTTADLLKLNPSVTEDTLLQIGDLLNVTALEPYVTVEVHYEAKRLEDVAFKKVREEDPSAFKGETHVKQKGADGKKSVTRLIRKQDGQVVGSSITEEHILTEPVDEITVVGTKVIPSRGTGEFIWPINGGYVSSQRGYRWGRVHEGIDIARPSSPSILAADNGVVTDVGYHSTYGNRIVIEHNNGYKTLYAHLSKIDVKVGQVVPQGSKIGVMGSTGRSTGPHLHFEVFKNGSNINPLSVLK